MGILKKDGMRTPPPGQSPDKPAHRAGVLLLLTAAITGVMVVARVAADADQETLMETLRAIAANNALYGISGGARLLSGATLFAASWLLLQTWILKGQWASSWVPYLFCFSGVSTVVSGACAIGLAVYLPQVAASLLVSDAVPPLVALVAEVREFVGKLGFASAGLAIVVAALYQWRVGGTLRVVAPASAILGVAMQFIWIDAATILHRVVGVVFFLSLVAIGVMLVSGRAERLFIAAYKRST